MEYRLREKQIKQKANKMKTLRLDPTKATTKVLDYLETLIFGETQIRDMDYKGGRCVYAYRNSTAPKFQTSKEMFDKLLKALETQHGEIKVIFGAAEYSLK